MGDLTLSSTDRLLASLGWPLLYKDAKGTLVWQRPAEADRPSDKTATASVTVTSVMLRARIVNILPNASVEPHLELEWDISKPTPMFRKFVYAGVGLPLTDATAIERATATFVSLVSSMNAQPSLEIVRHKPSPSADTVPALSPI